MPAVGVVEIAAVAGRVFAPTAVFVAGAVARPAVFLCHSPFVAPVFCTGRKRGEPGEERNEYPLDGEYSFYPIVQRRLEN